jgi:Lrp/AsnC family leucine-responsive transcriptional regulator
MEGQMIDGISRRILNILQRSARESNVDIARQVGLAPSAVFERIKKLEEKGVIAGYEARINPRALDLRQVAFIYVRADEPIGSLRAGKELVRIPEVQEVHHIAGEDCYLVKVRVADTEALGELLRQRFGAIETVRSTRTTVVLSTLKETAQLPIGLPEDEASVARDAQDERVTKEAREVVNG